MRHVDVLHFFATTMILVVVPKVCATKETALQVLCLLIGEKAVRQSDIHHKLANLTFDAAETIESQRRPVASTATPLQLRCDILMIKIMPI